MLERPGPCGEQVTGRRAPLTRADLHGPLGEGLVLGSGWREGGEGRGWGLPELSCMTDRESENVSSRCVCPYGRVGLSVGQGRFWARGAPCCGTSGPGGSGSAGDRDVAGHSHVGLQENGSRTGQNTPVSTAGPSGATWRKSKILCEQVEIDAN